MSKPFHLFPPGSPPNDTDKLLITRADITSPSGFSNYLLTWAELKATISGSSGPAGATIPGMDGEDGNDGFSIPGKDGNQGTSGIGINGVSIPAVDGEDGQDGINIPGSPGIQGNSGIAGVDGKPQLIIIEPEEPEFPMMIPGNSGVAGTNGSNGTIGRDGLIMLSQDGEDGQDGHTVQGSQGIQGNTGVIGAIGPLIWIPQFDEPSDARDELPAEYQSDKNMVYLGRKTGTGVTVGPLIWLENFEFILWKYQIGGYNGGTPVGRFLCAAGVPSTTALTNGNTLVENAVANLTSVSKPGCPLAVTLSAVGRSGWGTIRGESGALKQIDIRGMSGNPAVGTNPLLLEARSFFSDLTTNLPIKQIQLSVYDTLITTALSAQTFIATTYIEAWGFRRNQ